MRVGKKPAVAGIIRDREFFRGWEETPDVKSALAMASGAEAEGLLKQARAWISIARQRVEAHLKEMK